MKVFHQIRSFKQIIEAYDRSLPLHRFLVSFFKQNKQMGSTDRRWASRYVYAYFRLGNALQEIDLENRLAIADFLVNSSPSLVVETYLPQLAPHQVEDLSAKIAYIQQAYPSFKLEDLFPYQAKLSPQLEKLSFYKSLLVQPDLFIRMKAVDQPRLIHILEEAGVSLQIKGPQTLALPNGTKLDQVLPANSYYVQDLASQGTAEYFKPQAYDYWWDCCAASGGKSLLLHDLEPKVKLLVSDVRESSLLNLKERFQQAGIHTYQQKVLDLRYSPKAELHAFEFDGILLDAPCTGSGTWRRTPEMLSTFEEQKINSFVKLQRDIAQQVVPFLKSGKPLIYMTCSVFEAENESNIAYFTANLPLKLESMELLTGHQERADSLFVARLIKI